MISLLGELRKHTSLPIIIQPNAGLPESVNGKTVFNVSPEEFAEDMKKMAEIGVSYLGGCCGTTPEHISKMIELCSDMPANIPEKKNRTLVSSYSQTVELDKKPVVIGERINPTGKKLLKEALRRNDIDYIIREGTEQRDAGAHILDVNVGLPEIDEPAMMEAAVYNCRQYSNPLQIDTCNLDALKEACALQLQPLLNPLTAGNALRTCCRLPKIRRRDCVPGLDENGIPETAEGRFKNAKRIIAAAGATERKKTSAD
jgi:5-methyltetrahydrofolate--homocysteine methyltransferase